MPLSNLLHSAAGTCRYCGNKAGLIAWGRPECKAIHDAVWDGMVELAARAAIPTPSMRKPSSCPSPR